MTTSHPGGLAVNRREAMGLGAIGAGLVAAGGPAAAMPKPGGAHDLRVCNLENPLALGDKPPRFSWSLPESMVQSAYRVMVARTPEDLTARRNLLWDSGTVTSPQTFDIGYGGPTLGPREKAFWEVELWSPDRSDPLRSAVAAWETGLGDAPQWDGQWLAAETPTARADRLAGLTWLTGSERQRVGQPRFFRLSFDSEAPMPAEVLASAHELVELRCNGEMLTPTGDAPVRWTQMAVYPLRLRAGRNVITASVIRRAGFGVPGAALAMVLRHGADLAQRRSGAGMKTSLIAAPDWQTVDFDDHSWETAIPATSSLPIGQPWPAAPAVWLRRGFRLARPVRAARLYATALGLYEPWLNGAKVGTQRLAPEFTDPSRRVLYQAYDVTAQLRPGDNMLGLWVGDGWYGGRFSTQGRFAFGEAPCRALAQLEIEYVDGSREIVATGPGWETATSPILANSLYDGEIHDARLERLDWASPGADSQGWRPAEAIATKPPAIEPQRCPPIRSHELLQPHTVRKLGPGRYLVDFGQNFAGWPRLTLSAAAGARVRMRFGEVLGPDGGVDQANLRTALQRDIYIAAGHEREVWEPRFTYHGFRYVELDGLPEGAARWSLEAWVGHQDLASSGEFRTADPVMSRFWRNSVWSQKSNFFGLPTDCPQRDERLGWMGDAQVFWPAAAYNMDLAAFTARVMEDVRHAQRADGAFPDCIPPFVPNVNLSSPGWADAGIIIPYTAWRQYGCTALIAEHWPAMVRYMSWIARTNPDLVWRNGRGADYADWLAVDADASNPGKATTPKDLVATAYWAGDAAMMGEMAAALGRADEAARYRQLFNQIAGAFNAAFVHPDRTIGNGSQTGYTLAIRFGLLDSALRMQAGRLLAADIARRGNRLSTGFLGTPHILDALAMAGQESFAIGLLLERGYPSWGYMVGKGATTMWERWNSDVGDVGMNSYNHYAFGAIGAFLFRRIAGIAPAEPGFRRIAMAPIIDRRLGRAGATYHSASGTIRSDWQTLGNSYRLEIEVPKNVVAEVTLPGGATVPAPGGRHLFHGKLPTG